MLKKTTLVMLGLVANGIAVAGAMGPVCTPDAVTVPCEAKQWSFGLQALYLRAIDSADRGHRYSSFTSIPQLNNEWNWGFRAAAAYQFNTGNDATVSWMHYSNSAQQNGLYGLAAPLQTSFAYSINHDNRFDQINAVLGQHVDVGTVKKMRFYGGLQYVAIEQNATSYYQLPSGSTYNPASYFDDTDYNGVGPVAGIDYSYNVSPQITVLASSSASLLYGTTRVSTGYVLTAAHAVSLPVYASKKALVPSLEAKLGANYAYTMAQGVVNLEGGYEVVEYFSALQAHRMQSSTGISSVNYGLFGPYVGLKYVANA